MGFLLEWKFRGLLRRDHSCALQSLLVCKEEETLGRGRRRKQKGRPFCTRTRKLGDGSSNRHDKWSGQTPIQVAVSVHRCTAETRSLDSMVSQGERTGLGKGRERGGGKKMYMEDA